MTRSNENIMRAVAYNQCSPEAILAVLSLHDCADVRIGVACNTNTPAYVLQSLESDTEPEVLLVLSKHDNTPYFTRTAVLDKLSRHENPWTRLAAAQHISTSAHTLARLSADPEVVVVRAIAGHPSTPEDTLAVLSTHTDPQVRLAVACNYSTPASALEKLSIDPHVNVRIQVAQNERTPDAVRIQLIETLASDVYAKTLLWGR